ncbi:putative reverse transcriptase domain-containing protein [Tanacetum coccineum]
MLQEIRLRCPAISHWVKFCYSNPARLYYGQHTLWSYQGVQQGDPLGPLLFALVLHPLICKIRNSFSISFQAWYLDDGTIIGDTLVVEKILELIMEDGPHCGLHLNVDKTEIGPPEYGVKLLGRPVSVDFDYNSELMMKRVAKTIELMDDVAKINDLQCELLLLRSCAVISKLYFAMRTCSLWSEPNIPLIWLFVLLWSVLSLRLDLDLFASLQTKLLRHSSIVASGVTFEDALCSFNVKMKIDLLSNPTEIVAPKLMKKLANIYFTVFAGDIYGDHVVSCAGIVGIKHRHNVVRDTLVDICFRSGISAGKEVDIGLSDERDKPLRPTYMLLYLWDRGLNVCVHLTGSLPLTQTGMTDFMLGQAVIDATQRKHGKYMAKCAAIGYGFLPFSFSSLGELEADAVTLLKRIRKFSMALDIGARAAVYIFNRISFAIAKGVWAYIVSRLSSNLL